MLRFFQSQFQGVTPAVFTASPNMALARSYTNVPYATIHMSRVQESVPNGPNFLHANVLAVGRSPNQNCEYAWLDASGCR